MKVRRISRLLFVAILLWTYSDTSVYATTEELKRWIIANKHKFPREIRDSITNASGAEITAALLRMLGFKPIHSKAPLAAILPEAFTKVDSLPAMIGKGDRIGQIRVGEKESRATVCPFDSTPLLLMGEYSYCKPTSPEDCPAGYVCDQSFELGRSICCKEGDRLFKSLPTFKERNNLTVPSNLVGWKNIVPPKSTQEMIILGSKFTTNPPWNPFKPRPTVIPIKPGIEPFTGVPIRKFTIGGTATLLPYTPKGGKVNIMTTTMATITPAKPNEWDKLWSTTRSPIKTVDVSVIQTGSRNNMMEDQTEVVGAITLIKDGGTNVLVDTGAASETENLLRGLADHDVSLDDIQVVVVTHAHPGHVGNLNFFGQKPILFHSKEFIGHHVTNTELFERPYRKLTPNIEVWKTPGHTQHDLSVLVHNVPNYGTMAIVGDLIPAEVMLSEKRDPALEEGVWDSTIKRQNANLIICMADWVVPGHGAPFRVLAEYRQRAGCGTVASTRRKR
ncbi:unnamed protein product [Bursaphelenchus xylophilus]|uniref:(pine wood nematode) hypothetical protein n=1 Tax=Bursaphelenchus xylophilus TaxID=6326 RepID=A0A1I7SRS8_BURXY|nr:unnamed protein product [Bursaphelenchus xylophilus]CAG9101889.1 unnamed protein product [Bursaphelenchus xylophilus]